MTKAFASTTSANRMSNDCIFTKVNFSSTWRPRASNQSITHGPDPSGAIETLGGKVPGFRPGMAVDIMLPPERGAFAE